MPRVFPAAFVLTCLCLCLGSAASADTLENIKSRGYMIVGLQADDPPFGFVRPEDGVLAGFDRDISAFIAKKLGVELKLKPVESATGLDMLTQGTVDMLAAGLVHTFEGDEVIDFSLSYFQNPQGLLVSRGAGITSPEDLAGRKVAVLKGGPTGETGQNPIPESTIVGFERGSSAIAALQKDTVQAVAADMLQLARLRHSAPDPAELVLIRTSKATQYMGIGLPEDDSDFRDSINRILAEMWTSGRYEEIFATWFGPGTGYEMPLTWELEIWQ